MPWKHDTKFKCYQLVYLFANKVFEDVLLNATTVTEALEFYSKNMKIKASPRNIPHPPITVHSRIKIII